MIVPLAKIVDQSRFRFVGANFVQLDDAQVEECVTLLATITTAIDEDIYRSIQRAHALFGIETIMPPKPPKIKQPRRQYVWTRKRPMRRRKAKP